MTTPYVRWAKVKGENVWTARVRGADGHMLECSVEFKGYRDPFAKEPVILMDWRIMDVKTKTILVAGGNIPYSDTDTIDVVERTKELCETALQQYL